MSHQDFNLYGYFENQFSAHENKELLRTANQVSYSYADIDRQSARFANHLAAIGVMPGDRVSAQVHKSPEALCLYLACLRAGFVYQPLNPDYTSAELAYFLADAEPAAIVGDPVSTQLGGVERVLTLDVAGCGSLVEQSRGAAETLPTVARDKDELAALPYSSGTTGLPKGVMLSHGNLLSNTRTLVEAWGFTESDRLLHALPLFHVHGLFVATGCVFGSGASIRWLPGFNVADVVEYLPECTVMMGVPTYYSRLLARGDFDHRPCRNMRLFISGSAPLAENTFAAFESRTGHRILERYGMTETGMNTSNPLSGPRKPGTVGPPLPGVDVRIAGDEDIGELQLRGPNVFQGYWRLAGQTDDGFSDDGFFNSGDMASIDEDGYVSIVGRTRDLVITGGLNVYPKEVEVLIDHLPGVKESAVIGVPHADFGEGLVAVVAAEDNSSIAEDDIILAAKKNLANYKVPKRVVLVDRLPRNSMAKVQKNCLRETYRNLLS